MTDFTVGVLEAEMTAFGIGRWGTIPAKSNLAYPLLGVKGHLGAKAFSACAARNELNKAVACFCKVEGVPRGVFLGNYLDESEENRDMVSLRFFA